MRGRTGETHPRRNTPDGGDEIVDLVPHQQTTIAGLGPLAVLDFHRTGIFLHFRQSMDNLVPAEVSTGNLQNGVLQEP